MATGILKWRIFKPKKEMQEKLLLQIQEQRRKTIEKLDGIYTQLDGEDKWFVDQSHGQGARCSCDDDT